MGGGGTSSRDNGRRRAVDPTLAHSRTPPTAPVHGASHDVARGDPAWDAARVGSLLQLAWRVGAIASGGVHAVARPVRADLDARPTAERAPGHRDRQRSGAAIGALGAMDRLRVPATVSRETDAAPHNSPGAARRSTLQLRRRRMVSTGRPR